MAYVKQPDVGTGQTPSSLALADFDGDGVLDLAVTNLDDDSLQIFLGRRGGRFDAHAEAATGREPRTPIRWRSSSWISMPTAQSTS